jgi:hypothetical protein
MLTIRYGKAAQELMQTRGREVALWLAGVIVLVAVGWWLLQKRATRREQTGEA